MNGRMAKALRSEIYGSESKRNGYLYHTDRAGARINTPNTMRAMYCNLKKAWKASRKDN